MCHFLPTCSLRTWPADLTLGRGFIAAVVYNSIAQREGQRWTDTGAGKSVIEQYWYDIEPSYTAKRRKKDNQSDRVEFGLPPSRPHRSVTTRVRSDIVWARCLSGAAFGEARGFGLAVDYDNGKLTPL